jgi:ribonuclease BN (tRNA processing enzyme)
VDAQDRPCAIQYLKQIGVQPEISVRLIIATHWHDDHIRGLAETLRVCSRAAFCCSNALKKEEFLATVAPYNENINFSGGSGVAEIIEVMKLLKNEQRGPIARAHVDRRILHFPSDKLSHKMQCDVWALSPSDEQYNLFLQEISSLVPAVRQAKKRFPAPSQNHLSVATLVRVGPIGILLGADLEENQNPKCGWTAIINSAGRPQDLCHIFKVPHHGSENGHCEDVWKLLLVPRPISITTPYNMGKKPLPSEADRKRISAYSADFYLTSSRTKKQAHRRDPAVEKMARQAGKLVSIAGIPGIVRLRNGGAEEPLKWERHLSEEAFVVQ